MIFNINSTRGQTGFLRCVARVTCIVQFKLLTLMHGAIHANTPRYLADSVSAYIPSRSLRSADMSLLVVPRVNTEQFGRSVD